MPLEGHWRRINTPLRRLSRRERNVAIAAVALTLVAIAAVVIATLPNSRPASSARRICATRTQHGDPGATAIRESCRDAGLR